MIELGKVSRRSLLAVFLILLLAGTLSAQELNVRITRLAGPVEIRREGKTDWVRAKVGTFLKKGDSLRTLKGGKVQLVFPQNTIVLIKENSVLNLRDLGQGGRAKVRTLLGSFLFDLRKALSPGSSFEVETPSALAVVRGTKFGAEVSIDGTTVLTAYENSIEVIAQGVSITLDEGYQTTIPPGKPPSEPAPAEKTWSSDIFTPEDVRLPTLEEYESNLSRLTFNFSNLAEGVSRFYDEFRRYELSGDTARMSAVYYNLGPYKERFEILREEYREQRSLLSADPALSWVITGEEMPPFLGLTAAKTQEIIAKLKGYIESIEASISSIESAFENIDSAMAEFMISEEELTDIFRGTIESRDPAMDIRYGMIDTDNDGIPDIVEALLGIEAGSEEAIINLVSPEDEAEFYFPESSSISFEFAVEKEELFSSFELVLTAGGITSIRPFIGTELELPIVDLIEGPPSYAELFTSAEPVSFEWYIRGTLDLDSLSSEFAATTSASVSQERARHIVIESEHRTFTLVFPAGELVNLSLVPVGTADVALGDIIRLRVNIGNASGLTRWAIVINYDPTLVEFDSGRKIGLTSSSTLFFGDDGRGHLAISGQVVEGAQPVFGSGAFAEIVFSTVDTGLATFEFAGVVLSAVGDIPVDVGVLEGTEVEITASAG